MFLELKWLHGETRLIMYYTLYMSLSKASCVDLLPWSFHSLPTWAWRWIHLYSAQHQQKHFFLLKYSDTLPWQYSTELRLTTRVWFPGVDKEETLASLRSSGLVRFWLETFVKCHPPCPLPIFPCLFLLLSGKIVSIFGTCDLKSLPDIPKIYVYVADLCVYWVHRSMQ